MTIANASPYYNKKINRKILKQIEKVLESKRFIMGQNEKKFEAAFAKRMGVPYAVSLNSCTTALEITLRYLKLKGGEVLVPTNTFIATANAAFYAGGKPVFVEIEPETLCMSFSDMKKKVTRRTKAIIVVHIGGIISEELPKWIRWAKKRGIPVIEDCAHTIGSKHKKTIQPGSLGFAGAFSFWPTKILTTGTGGMLTTTSKGLAEYARCVRYHGILGGKVRQIADFGNDWAMNEVIACLGIGQLQVAEENIRKRQQVMKWYQKRLKSLHDVSIPQAFRRGNASFYKFWINFKKKVDVFELNRTLNETHQVQSEFLYWPPVPLMPLYQKMKKYPWKKYPQSDAALRNHLCLPLHPMMRERDVIKVVRALKASLNTGSGKKT